MARKVWHYIMSPREERLWNQEEMKGWRQAFEACVEDDAREEGCKKYVIYDTAEAVLTKGEVTALAPQI